MAAESALANPFDTINAKLDRLLNEVATLKEEKQSGPVRIPLLEYCRQAQISKPTIYQWLRRGLVQSEMVGGRRYIIDDGRLQIPRKYARPAV